MVWDATCSDTFAPSYTTNATREAGAVAALAEERKRLNTNIWMPHTVSFPSHAVETAGAFGPQTQAFLKDLGRRITRAGHRRCAITLLPHTESASGNPKSFSGWYIWSVSYSGMV